jgi:Spy/CpxP family protein refolding chaperone
MRFRAIFALPLMAALLAAQPPMHGPRPWWEGDIAKNLNLTEAQTKQILQTRQDFRTRMTEVRAAVNKAEKEVDAAFNDDPVDQTKASEAIERLAVAHHDVTKAVSEMELKFRMILTAQQWQQLKQQERTWPGPGRGHRGLPTPSPTNQK